MTAEEVAMFEMFEREAWTHERRREYILRKVRPLARETVRPFGRAQSPGC